MWTMKNLKQAFLESATRYFRESQSKEIDWEQRRYEIVKEILPSIIGDTIIDDLDVVEVVKGAVRLSDELIEELKKK